jgi:hypothetical protein
MWTFDFNGDLYFEKAVDGFLAELFKRWEDQECDHDVTIVLFSRLYYRATSIDEFPEKSRDCINRSNFGRFYEDFYLVPVQNERYENWTPVLVLLRQIFHQWKDMVFHYHQLSSKIRQTVTDTIELN